MFGLLRSRVCERDIRYRGRIPVSGVVAIYMQDSGDCSAPEFVSGRFVCAGRGRLGVEIAGDFTVAGSAVYSG